MSQEPTRAFNQVMLSAWQAELKATRDPSLKQQLSHREGELLPRFAEHYQQLKALRRQVRRSLQRQWKRSLERENARYYLAHRQICRWRATSGMAVVTLSS